MSQTAQQLITRAAKSLGYLGRTAVLSAADANDGLVAFNAMLDSWSNEKLMSYVVLETSFPLVPGTSAYTIGPSGAAITAARPLNIDQAYVQDGSGNNYIMRVLPRDKWNQIGNRGATITSQIPTDMFYDPQNPNGVINIYPTPLLGYSVFINTTQDQTDFAALATVLAMPEGYERAYVTNLALELMSVGFPCMLSPQQLQSLIATASNAKGNIKRTNIKDVIADYDDALITRSYATYNPYTDSFGRPS
jgi:hypothetical protein